MATHLTWTRKSYWRARGPDGEYVAKENGSTNFATPEELWEGIANSPLRGEFDVEPARFRVSKGYGVLSPDTGDTSPPTVPTGLSGSPLSATSIYLSWGASTDNVGVVGYQIYRNGVPLITTQDTNYTDTGLIPSTQYSYQVSASDAAGNSSALTSAVLVTTNANSAPSWSTSAQSLTIGVAYSLNLNSICVDNDGHPLTFTQVSGTLPAGLTFSNGVVSGTPTTAGAPAVTFRANDGYTTVDRTITFTVTQSDTTPPDVPTGLAVGTPASNSLPLTWNANPSGQGLAGYKLYRSLDGTNYSLHQTLPTSPPSYNDGSLNADTTYYYKLSAFDNATPVANESAQSAAVSGRTNPVADLAWSGNPFPMTVPAGSYVDLEQYISDPANELGGITSIGEAFPTGVEVEGPPDVATWRVTVPSGTPQVTTGTGSGHKLRLHTSIEADWLLRSGQNPAVPQPGVVWYHDFRSAAEVNAFRWTNAYVSGNDPLALGNQATNVRHITTDGITGGCLECYYPSGGTNSCHWIRPFSPLNTGSGKTVSDPGANGSIPVQAWNPTNGGNQTVTWDKGWYGNALSPGPAKDWTEFYIQLRVKMDPNRIAGGNTAYSVGKFLWFSTTPVSFADGEVVVYSYGKGKNAGGNDIDDGNNYFRVYTNNGSGTPPLVSGINDIQPGGVSPFWYWSGGWDTIHIKLRPGAPGVSSGANSSRITVEAAHSGETSYTTIMDVEYNQPIWQSVSGQNKGGLNAFYGSAYNNNYPIPVAFYHRYAQIIFSLNPIPCPQDGV